VEGVNSVDHKTDPASIQEMEALGWWFVAEVLPMDWRVRNLILALEASRRIDLDHTVIERLAAAAADFPSEAIQAAGLLVAGDHEGWGVYASREELIAIVSAAQQSGDAVAIERGRSLVNELLTRGYTEFRRLTL
jgi:hypothetical protein